MLSVTIHVENPAWKTALRPCRKTVCEACEASVMAGRKHREVSVVLADDDFVKTLNHTYRGKNKATNVLSFPGEGKHLGDIVLSLSTLKREARDQGKSVRHHALHLLVHGMLHLDGYDHMTAREAEKMEKKEIRILKKLGVANPYL